MVPGALDAVNDRLAGRYELIRELGHGGMATVYLERDLRHDRHVAVRILLPELAAQLSADRFLREIQVIAQMTHAHMPRHSARIPRTSIMRRLPSRRHAPSCATSRTRSRGSSAPLTMGRPPLSCSRTIRRLHPSRARPNSIWSCDACITSTRGIAGSCRPYRNKP